MAKINNHKILDGIVKQYASVREFARAIQEDPSDIHRWLSADRSICTRAVITICRAHPEILPWQLNDVFPKDLTFKFTKENRR